MSRAAVKPARKSACVFCTAISVDISRDMPGFGVLNMCVCASISPGSTVCRDRSMTEAPAGIFSLRGRADVRDALAVQHDGLVGAHLARVAVEQTAGADREVSAGAGHLFAALSMAPKHGCVPAPRQGWPGPPTPWASAAVERSARQTIDEDTNA